MKKKLSLIIVLSLVGVLVLTTVLLAVINKNFSPEFEKSMFEVHIVDSDGTGSYDMGKNEGFSTSQKQNFEKFEKQFKNMFKQSVLSAVFNGNSSDKVEIKYHGTSLPSTSGYNVNIKFEESVLMKDGKPYKINQDSEDLLFERLIVFVSDTQGFKEFKLYAKVKIEEDRFAYYEISTIANTNQMFDFLSEINYQ